MEKYHRFARAVFLGYYPLGEKSLSALLSIAEVRQVAKGESLLQVGEVSRKMYILYQGVVTAYFLDEEGNAYHKNIFLEGDFLGSKVSALTGAPSGFALEAVEDCTLIGFNYRAYKQLIREYEDMKNFYIAYLEKNWILDKEKREIDIVMKDAGARYLEYISQHPGIDNRVPLHLIASHLGITPTQLSRIRKNLKKSG